MQFFQLFIMSELKDISAAISEETIVHLVQFLVNSTGSTSHLTQRVKVLLLLLLFFAHLAELIAACGALLHHLAAC